MTQIQRLDYSIADNAISSHIAVVDGSKGSTLATFPLPSNEEDRTHMELLIIGAVEAANSAQEPNLERLLIRAATHCSTRRVEGMTPMQEALHRGLIEAAAKAIEMPEVGAEYLSTDPSMEGTVVVTNVANGRVFYTGDAEGDATINAFWQGFAPMESYDITVKVSVRSARSAEAAAEQVRQLMDYALEVSNDDGAITGYALCADNEIGNAVAGDPLPGDIEQRNKDEQTAFEGAMMQAAFEVGELSRSDLEDLAADFDIPVDQHTTSDELRANVLEKLEAQGEPCTQVEYDDDFWGGDYSGEGKHVYVPEALIHALDGDIDLAFGKFTHKDPIHVITYAADEVYSAAGEPFVGYELVSKAMQQANVQNAG